MTSLYLNKFRVPKKIKLPRDSKGKKQRLEGTHESSDLTCDPQIGNPLLEANFRLSKHTYLPRISLDSYLSWNSWAPTQSGISSSLVMMAVMLVHHRGCTTALLLQLTTGCLSGFMLSILKFYIKSSLLMHKPALKMRTKSWWGWFNCWDGMISWLIH